MGRVLKILASTMVLAVCMAFPAFAQFEVQESTVEKGELEIEIRGAHFSGHPRFMMLPEGAFENEVVRHGVAAEAELGVNNWLQLSFEVELEQERGEDGSFGDFQLSEIGFGVMVELVELNVNGVGLAFQVEFETPVRNEKSTTYDYVNDEAEVENEFEGHTLSFGPVVTLAQGPLSATANLFFAYNFGAHSKEWEYELDMGMLDEVEEFTQTKGPDHWDFNYAVQVKYQVTKMFGVGVEAHGSITDISDNVPVIMGYGPTDKHHIGPVLYISFGDDDKGEGGEAENGEEEEEEGVEIAAAIGVLFGLNDDTSDIAVKWDLEVEF